LKKFTLFVALLSLTSLGWAQSHREASTDRLDKAGRVISEIMSAPDKGIPEEVLNHAKCIAVGAAHASRAALSLVRKMGVACDLPHR